MEIYQRHTFESTFTKEISSILIEFLTLPEIFFKFRALSKDCRNILETLKSFPKLWRVKYMQEFMSQEDKICKKYASPEGIERFMNLFRDNQYDPNGALSMFEFFKQSVEKQISMRETIKEIIVETNKLMLRNNQYKNSGRESITDFIRPYTRRHDFDCEKCGIAEDVSFEIFVFFRSFYNPDLEGFSTLNLYQYHILFQLLEHEMTFTETEVQGINLKFVLFSATTCSNMAKFLR
jgi:hypothetical protein